MLIQKLIVGSLTPLVEDQHLSVVLQISSIFGTLHFFRSMSFQLILVFFSAERGRPREREMRGRERITTDMANLFHVQYMKGSIQLEVHRTCFLIAGCRSGLKVDNRPHSCQFGQKPKLGHSKGLSLMTHPSHFTL